MDICMYICIDRQFHACKYSYGYFQWNIEELKRNILMIEVRLYICICFYVYIHHMYRQIYVHEHRYMYVCIYSYGYFEQK
jgi:hypothetical protein